MRLEKGMSLTQKCSIKEIVPHSWFTPTDDFTDWNWYIKDINTISLSGKKIIVYTIVNKNEKQGVQANEDTLRMFFSPWCDWKKQVDSSGNLYCYKTNQRLTFVKKEYDGKVFKGWSACHAEDSFDLHEGLKIALKRVEDKIKTYKNEKENTFIKPNKFDVKAFIKTNKNNSFGKDIDVGFRCGDLEVIAYMGKDSSRHHLWKCRCECGNTIVVRSTNLRNHSKTSCGKCSKKTNTIINPICSKKTNTIINPIWGFTSVQEQDNIKKYISIFENKNQSNLYNKQFLKNNNMQFEKEFEWSNNHFALRETTGELLEAPCYNYIVHTISADYDKEGAIGTTKDIIDLFDIAEELKDELDFLKKVASYNMWLINKPNEIKGEIVRYDRNVLSMIVKLSRYDTVDYNTLILGLNNLRRIVENNHITYIAMPRICCGREKLDWLVVRKMIIDTFKDIDFNLTITVYHK